MHESELVLEIGHWLSEQEITKLATMNSADDGSYVLLDTKEGERFKITIVKVTG